MNENSRTKNSVFNIITNITYQIFIILLTFFTRRIFINSIGIDFLGISSLFTSILSVLSLAELGISSAISFSMYKYIAAKDTEKLKALNTYYKTLYNRIAIIVLVIGVSLLPFLKYIINLEQEVEYLELYYIINLLNSVCSYLFIYKTTIVSADQKGYRLKVITCVIEFTKISLQMFVLYVFKSYLLYLFVLLVFTFLGNFIQSKLSEKWYPFIKETSLLEENEKKEIWSNIKSMFFYRFGGVVMRNTDNIVISTLISTTMVGIYSNYSMIFNKIDSFVGLLFNSIIASVGNLNITSSKQEKYKIYKVFMFISFILFAIFTIGIFYVGEDVVIAVTKSKDFLIPKDTFIVGLSLFLISGLCYPNGIFRETTGLFKMAKYSMLICSILNIILSFILGKSLGLFGVILATIISRLLTNIWYEPYLLYKNFFGEKVSKYYITQITRIMLCFGIILALYPIMSSISIEHLYLRIFVKGIICVAISSGILFLCFRRSEELEYLLNKFKDILEMLKIKSVMRNNK